MRSTLLRWLLPLGLITATAVDAVPTAQAQPGPRERRPAMAPGPREAPPPPRAERRGAYRRGQVWVGGYWDWRNNRWTWVRGKWQRPLGATKRWREPRWELKGDVYVRVGGDWDDAPQYPDRPPPSPQAERAQKRRGYVWVPGEWDWQNGDWVWIAGRFEREKRGSRWEASRWQERNGRWEREQGGWRDGAPTGGDGAPASTWRFEERGWTMIGEKTVDGRVDADQVDFSQKMGKVSKITIVVIDSDLEMIDLNVVFVSGKNLKPTGTQFFREGTRTRVIDLPAGEILRAVQFKYRNLPGGGRARVQVWGNVK